MLDTHDRSADGVLDMQRAEASAAPPIRLVDGVLAIILGVLLFSAPSAGLIAWAWLIGIYAIVYGVLYIVAGFRLKRLEPSQSASSR